MLKKILKKTGDHGPVIGKGDGRERVVDEVGVRAHASEKVEVFQMVHVKIIPAKAVERDEQEERLVRAPRRRVVLCVDHEREHKPPENA